MVVATDGDNLVFPTAGPYCTLEYLREMYAAVDASDRRELCAGDGNREFYPDRGDRPSNTRPVSRRRQ